MNNFLNDLITNLIPPPIPRVPESIIGKIRLLIGILRDRPCLLIIDNVDAIFPRQNSPDYQAYRELFRLIGNGRHQSCVLLTGRITQTLINSGENLSTASLYVPGLQTAQIQQLFGLRARPSITFEQACFFRDYYGGNPLILAIIANTIQTLFQGNIAVFLKQEMRIVPDIAELLEKQIESLSKPEKEVIKVLANQNKLLSFADLRSLISRKIPTFVLLKSIKSLKELSLIKDSATYFALKSLFRDYLKKNWVVHSQKYSEPNLKIFMK